MNFRYKQPGKSKGLSNVKKAKILKDRSQQLPLLKKIKAAPTLSKAVSLKIQYMY